MRAYPNTANEKPNATNKQEPPPVKPPQPVKPPVANPPPAPPDKEHSICMPDFKRLNYFYGQLLGVTDFQTEQNFFREKLKLHNRCLHGYGVICGLKVVPEPGAEECAPEIDKEVKEIQAKMEELRAKWNEIKRRADPGDQGAREQLARIEQELEELRRKRDKIRTEECDEEKPTRVIIECGLALDCDGNELVVGHDLPVDLWRHLDRADRQRITDGEHTIYLSICYCEQPTDPARPVLPDACGATSECNYGKLRDSVKVRVTVDPPEQDQRCATCCDACADPCLLLARIDEFYRGRPLLPEDIHNEVRRPLATYVPTTITGISWTDGAEYTEDEAEGLLGVNPRNLEADDTDRPKGYLLVTFSRPVLTSTLKRGVIDIWSLQGGGGRMADIFNLDVEYVDLPDPAKESTIDRVRFRVTSDESPNPGDRVMIFVRAPRILDECCRPVDGAHTGGRVPFVDDQEFKDYRRDTDFVGCIWPPPFGYGPWTSGTGSPGANFESWFYVKPNPKSKK
jgi:hypothetical protein